MMRREFFLLAAMMLCTTAAAGRAVGDVHREKPERRPYIVEIGEPYSISLATMRREAQKMNELTEYLDLYGEPDYVEIQEIEPEWPWESYEVRLFYLLRNIETDFGHVLFSPGMTNLGVLKFQGEIPPDKRHQIEVILQARLAPPVQAPPMQAPPMQAPPVQAPPVQVPPAEAPAAQAPAAPPAVVEAPPPAPEAPHTGGLTEALVARIEAAAERAAQAADRAVEQSEAAARAADRTVTVVERIAQSAAPSQRRSR
jgi:hypothetical protein